MSSEISSMLSLTPVTVAESEEEFTRHVVNYPPDVWGDHFFNCTLNNETTQAMKKEVEMLKEQVREELLATLVDPLQCPIYINTLELLGVAYHFNNEVEDALQCIYKNHHSWDKEDSLYLISLRFRLLRQHGIYISCDVLEKFRDEKGDFKESLITDVLGMLALYEASHLSVHGEEILDQALTFTIIHLKYVATRLSHPLARHVAYALKRPIHRFYSRIDHAHYISGYKNDPSHSRVLLEFAKLDFNLVQSVHKKELYHLNRWWKSLNFAAALPFTRDRMVELYYIYTAPHFEPQHAALRVAISKASATLTLTDDIYDGYGTIEELELLTEAFERWDKSCADQLPDYLKSLYTTHLDIYEELEQELVTTGRSNCVQHIREGMKMISRSYFQDAKWRRQKENVPTYDEYFANSTVSIATGLLYSLCFIFIEEVATADVLEWANCLPKPVKACHRISRLLNEISNPSKQRDGILSTVTCYMKEFNVSEQKAIEELRKQIDHCWKDLNEEILRPNVMPMPVIDCLVRLARTAEVLYFEGDDPISVVPQSCKDAIEKLFGDPIQI